MDTEIELLIEKYKDHKYIGSEYSVNINKASTPYIYNGKVIGLPFNLQQTIFWFGKEFIPNCQGLYHLFLDSHLVYIGMSKNIRGRLLNHLKDDDMVFDNVLWFCMEDYSLEHIIKKEKELIKQMRPSLNTQYISSR